MTTERRENIENLGARISLGNGVDAGCLIIIFPQTMPVVDVVSAMTYLLEDPDLSISTHLYSVCQIASDTHILIKPRRE